MKLLFLCLFFFFFSKIYSQENSAIPLLGDVKFGESKKEVLQKLKNLNLKVDTTNCGLLSIEPNCIAYNCNLIFGNYKIPCSIKLSFSKYRYNTVTQGTREKNSQENYLVTSEFSFKKNFKNKKSAKNFTALFRTFVENSFNISLVSANKTDLISSTNNKFRGTNKNYDFNLIEKNKYIKDNHKQRGKKLNLEVILKYEALQPNTNIEKEK
ncbi:MAG: hypothetical protein JSS63_11550 [Bacteroidetes bacterium]|nr:hypothetical protein [Bacteroidota bacterium]